MSQFTQDNTDGFTNEQLTVLNKVYAKLMSDADESDTDGYAQWGKSVSDAINNAWIDGMDARDLERSARRKLGVW